jgi:hypothetical protein
MFWNVDLPEPNDDDFDKDITNPFAGDEPSPLTLAFVEMQEAFQSLMDAGFTENQALKFLAFCSIYEGDF